MAGIGFELRRMIDEEDGLVSRARGYASAGLIAAGPWIMTVITIGALGVATPYVSDQADYELFRGLVTYAFAFSLVTVGLLQMAATRHVADLLFGRQHEDVLPAFNTSALTVAAVQTVVGASFCVLAGLPLAVAIPAVSLYVVVSLTWLALIWLGVTKEYDSVLQAYALGAVVSGLSILLAWLGTGTAGMLTGYAIGQAVTLALLMRTLVRGMALGTGSGSEVLTSMHRFPLLVVVGFAYNAGIWVDKMVFWFVDGVGPHAYIRFHPLYDSCCFIGYLTVVPALAVNLVRVETSFYERYRRYYGAILEGLPLATIEEARRDMVTDLRGATSRLLRVQGAITAMVLIMAEPIMTTLGLPPGAVPVFRAACLGAFFHVMLLVTLLLLLYFDLRKEAALSACVFFVSNAVLALWSLSVGMESYGVGYALAALLSLVVAYGLLSRALDELEFRTFTRQPVETA